MIKQLYKLFIISFILFTIGFSISNVDAGWYEAHTVPYFSSSKVGGSCGGTTGCFIENIPNETICAGDSLPIHLGDDRSIVQINSSVPLVDSNSPAYADPSDNITHTEDKEPVPESGNMTCRYRDEVKYDSRNVTLDTTDFDNVWVADAIEKDIIINFPLITERAGVVNTISLDDEDHGINNINFTFTINDNTYLNAFNFLTNNSAVDILGPTTDTLDYGTRERVVTFNNYSLVNTIDRNGDGKEDAFVFKFKFYNASTSIRSLGSLDFDIEQVSYSVNFKGGATYNENVYDTSGVVISSANIKPIKVRPLVYTTITGDLRTGGFVEGASQSSGISFINNDNTVSISNPNFFMEFGGLEDSDKLDMKYSLSSSVIPSDILSNNRWMDEMDYTTRSYSNYQFMSNVAPNFNNLDFYSILELNLGEILSVNTKIYLSTHVSFILDGKTVVYNSDTIGKNHYYGPMTTIEASGTIIGVKVLGQSHSTAGVKELVESQDDEDLHVIGNVEKPTLRKDIKMNVYNTIRNVDNSCSGTCEINDLTSSFTSSGGGTPLSDGNVIYFSGLNGGNVILGNGDEEVQGKKTIIIEGGNLYIKNDMYYSDKSSDILGIVVLKDDDGKGGNLYIDPEVTNIVGTIYVDKSIISYDGTNELDGTTNVSVLKNQLHIYGSLFSENTIGGSKKNPYECPYYVEEDDCSSPVVAEKYDLNYLRRFYLINNGGILVPNGNGKVMGGGLCDAMGICTGGNSAFARVIEDTTDNLAGYPTFIEYNPIVQSSPPPFFEIKK